VSAAVVVGLSGFALLLVVIGYLQPHEFARTDEGTLAHLFQFTIAALLPAGLVFLTTADWREPVRNVRVLALSAVLLVVAFSALYYAEHTYR
jgi:uncharacterized membrane protein